MSYLAQGLTSGFNMGFDTYNQRKRDKEIEERALAREAQKLAAQQALQQEKLAQDAKLFFADQQFRGGQAEADRGFRREERVGSEQWKSGESGKDRALSVAQLEARMKADAEQLQARLAQEKLLTDAKLMQSQGQFDKKFDWEKDPANPDNKSREAYAKKIAYEMGDFGALPSPVTYKSPDEVKAAYQSGKLSREEAANILRSTFGLK